MTKTMLLELRYDGGRAIEQELTYEGEPEEVARDIDQDNNALLEYMLYGDDKGVMSFCFKGFIFRKEGLLTANMTETEW